MCIQTIAHKRPRCLRICPGQSIHGIHEILLCTCMGIPYAPLSRGLRACPGICAPAPGSRSSHLRIWYGRLPHILLPSHGRLCRTHPLFPQKSPENLFSRRNEASSGRDGGGSPQIFSTTFLRKINAMMY